MQAVVTGEIGKRRVVNHKGMVCSGSGECLPYEAVGMLYLAAEGIIAFQVSAFITFIDAAQRTQNIARDDLGVGSGVPYMGFYAGGVVVLLPVFRMPMAVGIVATCQRIAGAGRCLSAYLSMFVQSLYSRCGNRLYCGQGLQAAAA